MAVWICREFSRSNLSVSIYYALELDLRVKIYDHLNFLRASVVYFRASRNIIDINHTPYSKFVAVWIYRELLRSILSVSKYYAPESDLRVKSYYHLNFRVSQYIIGLNHTPESKVMAVWIWRELTCLIFIVSIYYAPESDLRVKSYDHLNFSRAFIVLFWVSQYIIGHNHTPEWKVMAVWIWRELSCSISIVSIYYAAESDLRVKSYDHLNFSRASVVHFRAPRYIIGVNHTPDSKVTVVWICRDLPRSILSVSIYYAVESDLRVKSYDHLKFSSASVVHFRASRYIIGINHTPDSKVMAVWICQELPRSIFSVSIYYAPESDHQVKRYDHLNFSRLFVVHFLASRYIIGINHTPESKVMAVWTCRELPRSILSVSIYYATESDLRVKSYDHLKFSRASIVHFRASRYIIGINHTPDSKVTAIWICRELPRSILSVSIYYAPESDLLLKGCDHLNFSRASAVHFRASRYIIGINHTPESNVMAAWIWWEL